MEQPIDVPALAAQSHVSTSHLTALFRRKFRCGPLRYHQNLRMSLARRLLLNPYLSIGEIAQNCGYEDVNYFVRLFRKRHEVPPAKWRQDRQSET